MRALTLLAATAMVHMVRALPRQDLAIRQNEYDLSNDSHVFHHLDRNQRTANRDRNRISKNSAGGMGPHVSKGLPDGPQRAGGRTTMKERAMSKRFIQDPDYSQEDPEDSSNSTSPASNTMPTQQPATREKPGEADNSHGRP